MIDPTFTKIALQKCKRSGKYNVWKIPEDVLKLKKGFEKLTNLCSCFHIDSNPIISNKTSSVKGDCYIYFAVNIPIKNYSTNTLEQHAENYQFVNLSQINDSCRDVAWFVKSNIMKIKDYCKNKSKINLIKPICESCVIYHNKKPEKRIRLVIFDQSYKSFILFKKDDVFGFPHESSNENLTEKDQVTKMLSDLLQNFSFDVDLESVVDKKNVFSMYYCTANNIDKINNVLFYLCINIKMLIAGIKISKHVHF